MGFILLLNNCKETPRNSKHLNQFIFKHHDKYDVFINKEYIYSNGRLYYSPMFKCFDDGFILEIKEITEYGYNCVSKYYMKIGEWSYDEYFNISFIFLENGCFSPRKYYGNIFYIKGKTE